MTTVGAYPPPRWVLIVVARHQRTPPRWALVIVAGHQRTPPRWALVVLAGHQRTPPRWSWLGNHTGGRLWFWLAPAHTCAGPVHWCTHWCTLHTALHAARRGSNAAADRPRPPNSPCNNPLLHPCPRRVCNGGHRDPHHVRDAGALWHAGGHLRCVRVCVCVCVRARVCVRA